MATHINCTFNTPIEQAYNNIKNATSSQELLNNICYIIDNKLYIDYRNFKPIGGPVIYDQLLAHIHNIIKQILSVTPELIAYVSFSGFSIRELDKHLNFFKTVSFALDSQYPNKLSICYIHNATSTFTHLFNLLSCFVDKDTLSKVKLVNK
jgi:hypothetical protein